MKSIIVLASCLLLFSCASTPPALQSSAPGTFMRHGKILIDLKTDKSSYREGEEIRLKLWVSQTANVRIFNENVSGVRKLIWPNHLSGGDGIVSSGKTISIPGSRSSYRLEAAHPLGVNTLIAIASTESFQNGFDADKILFGTLTDNRTFSTKGITWSVSPTPEHKIVRVGEARLLYEVE